MARANVITAAPMRAQPALAIAPSVLLKQMEDAVLPQVRLDEVGIPIEEPDEDERTYRSLAPLIGGYTVEDAAMLLAACFASGDFRTGDGEAELEAAYRVRSMLQSFVAEARISGIGCAQARAKIMALPMDDRHDHPSEFAVRGMIERVQWDLCDVIGGTFYGDRFAGCDATDDLPKWFDSYRDRLRVWSAGQ